MRQLKKRLSSNIVLIFCLGLCGVWQSALARDAEAGKPAPAIEAQTLAGNQFSLAALSGKVVVINIWATWCGPCREEMPALESFYKKYHPRGLEMLAISADSASDLQKVREVMSAFSFPAALLSDTKMPGYGRPRSIPQTYVIDANGVLRRDGFVDKGIIDTELLERLVAPLLARTDLSATR